MIEFLNAIIPKNIYGTAMNFLITGFEPFDDSPLNPSNSIIDRLSKRTFDNYRVHTSVLPVDTNTAPIKLINELQRMTPNVVICLGQASGRTTVSLERIAINLLDFRIPDNKGNQIEDRKIITDGPAAYFSTLPIKEIQKELRKAGFPSEISCSAGTYLCNQVFYYLMHKIEEQRLPTKAGFIHLPALPEQVIQTRKPSPSMSLDTSFHAILNVIDTTFALFSNTAEMPSY